MNVTFWNALRFAIYLTKNYRGARLMEILHAGKNHDSSIEDKLFVERIGKILEV